MNSSNTEDFSEGITKLLSKHLHSHQQSQYALCLQEALQFMGVTPLNDFHMSANEIIWYPTKFLFGPRT